LSAIKNENKQLYKNVEKAKLEMQLSEHDLMDKQREAEKRQKEDEWMKKMSFISETTPFDQQKKDKLNKIADEN